MPPEINQPIKQNFSEINFKLLKLKQLPTAFNNEKYDASQQQLRHDNEVHNLRKEYIPKVLRISRNWLGFIAFFISIYTLLEFYISFHSDSKFQLLPPTVLIALLGTTTINVIGLFYIVAKWLYPNTIRNKKII